MVYNNTPTVSVVLVPVITANTNIGLLMVRRRDNGLLALPGGFQERPETVQAAGAREVFEETNININSDSFKFVHLQTVPDGSVNLAFFYANYIHASQVQAFSNDEVIEILVITEPCVTAFPLHTQMVEKFFEDFKFG